MGLRSVLQSGAIFFGCFRSVKTLNVHDHLVKEVSRCLELDDGEHVLELLPELQELTYSGSNDTSDVFTSFIDPRQEAGRLVTLTPLSGGSSQGFRNHLTR
jgi:hypothetical protein